MNSSFTVSADTGCGKKLRHRQWGCKKLSRWSETRSWIKQSQVEKLSWQAETHLVQVQSSKELGIGTLHTGESREKQSRAMGMAKIAKRKGHECREYDGLRKHLLQGRKEFAQD